MLRDEADEREAIDGRSFYEDRHRRTLEAAMLLMVCAVIVAAMVFGAICLAATWINLGKGPWH